MNSDFEIITREKETWGKIYTDIFYAIDNISPFLPEDFLKKKKFYVKGKVLKDFINLLEEEEQKGNKKGFFNKFSSPNLSSINNFKAQNKDTLTQLENCSKCACLNCVVECSFKTCSGCRRNSYIRTCDHSKINVRLHSGFTLDLTNNDTGKENRFKVLATLENCEKEQEYIIIQNIMDSNDRYILYLYPGIKEDTYGEITDEEEFDLIAESFESIEA
ncbi:DUF1292 domain-containing protein [Clostridium sp. YIM B02551]|uniref:DUF1292 domain-containing protein n=1 Tax=Clostridium sp. YIM B02551 TaxID=2910679 RepID=UPI001EEB2C03|nr:DUF1292 domain-containing protein [Clostridium sp. YIM B02551]